MSNFDEREKAFEARFRQDQEIEFKVQARRNFLFGKWAAVELGITGDDADAYCKEVVFSDFQETGDQDVLEKVSGDFKARNVQITDHILRKKMDGLMDTAREQIEDEG